MSTEAGKNPDAARMAELDLVEDGLRLVSLTFTVTFYTDVMFSTIPDAILASFDLFKRFCPEDRLKYYLTENMKQHKPVTPRALGMLRTWLKPGAPPREFIALELTDGEHPDGAPKYKFKVWGNEPNSLKVAEDGNYVHMAFPTEWGLERTKEMFDLVVDIAGFFPYQSALAGFGFECTRGKRRKAETFAWARSMRHRGVDIFVHPYDTLAVGKNAIKGVNWLTVLCDAFVDRLGGRPELRRPLPGSVDLKDLPGGLLLKSGPVPRLGDTNRQDLLPEYKAVYKAVAPLAELGYERTIMFLAGDASRNYEANTAAWQRRFADA
jgi:hypothetical protein